MTVTPDAHIEARTDEILEAAFRVFVRKGVEPARMQDIAREAGLSAGALYRYFESKDALTRAVFESCEAKNRKLFESARADTGTALEAIVATGHAAWSWFADDDALDRLMVHLDSALAGARDPQGLGAELGAHLGEVIDGLEALVRTAQEAGELAEDLDARALAGTLLAVHQGLGVLLVSLSAVDQDLDPEAAFQVLTRMLNALSSGGGTQDVAS